MSTKLTICGREYTIQTEPLADDFGQCHPAMATISLSDDIESKSTISVQTIELHEIIHAIMYETGLTCLIKSNIEEAIVHALAIQLFNVGYRRQ